MSYTHFQSDILPSPFMATDQIINTLVYGSFYDNPSAPLKIFLVPTTEIGISKSYLLWSLYSYLFSECSYSTILYIWHGDVDFPTLSNDEGMQFVLGKTIEYDRRLLEQLPFPYVLQDNFLIDQSLWAQHCYYQSLGTAKLIPLVLPYEWLEHDDNKQLLSDLLSQLQVNNNVGCILIDDFEIDSWEDDMELIVQQDSLSDYYNRYGQQIDQEAHLLMIQPSTDDESVVRSWWVLGLV